MHLNEECMAELKERHVELGNRISVSDNIADESLMGGRKKRKNEKNP